MDFALAAMLVYSAVIGLLAAVFVTAALIKTARPNTDYADTVFFLIVLIVAVTIIAPFLFGG